MVEGGAVPYGRDCKKEERVEEKEVVVLGGWSKVTFLPYGNLAQIFI